ncbi:MAG: thioesterase family protein [Verrucomicrobiota bacterium]
MDLLKECLNLSCRGVYDSVESAAVEGSVYVYWFGVSMKKEFVVRHRVAFSETDMAGIVHFSNYFRYMEIAEDAFFREHGQSLIRREEGEVHGWPRVRASCDFKAPISFGEEVEIVLFVSEVKVRAIEFAFALYRVEDGLRGKKIARGRMTTVHVVRRTGEAVHEMEALAIPEDFQKTLAEWVD